MLLHSGHLGDPSIARRNGWGRAHWAWGKTHAGDARTSICSGCGEVTPGTGRETRAGSWGWRDALGHPCSVHPKGWRCILGGLCKEPVILVFPNLVFFLEVLGSWTHRLFFLVKDR